MCGISAALCVAACGITLWLYTEADGEHSNRVLEQIGNSVQALFYSSSPQLSGLNTHSCCCLLPRKETK